LGLALGVCQVTVETPDVRFSTVEIKHSANEWTRPVCSTDNREGLFVPGQVFVDLLAVHFTRVAAAVSAVIVTSNVVVV